MEEAQEREEAAAESTQVEEVQPEPAENAEIVENTDGDSTPPEDTQKEEEAEEKPKPSGIQKRIDKLTREKYEERRRAELAEQELERLKGQGSQETEQGKPSVDSFDDYDAYLEALADWKVSQRLAKQQEEARLRSQAEQIASKQVAIEQAALSIAAAGKQKYEDFDAVIASDGVTFTDEMVEALASSEHGAEVAYYLGKNPSESQKLAMLPPVQLGRAIAMIESEVSRPVPASIPKPADTVTTVGESETVNVDPDSLPIDEWMRRENERLNKLRA